MSTPRELAMVEVTDKAYRERLRDCLRSPSGRVVLQVLAERASSRQRKPATAQVIADQGFVSTTSARAQAYRAAKLGYARQTKVRANGMPAMAWQITERGRDFLLELAQETQP